MTTLLQSETILKELHEIYILAIEKKQFTVALKIQELLGREVGLFSRKTKEIEKRKSKVADKTKLAIDNFSDEDITKLIDALEEKLTNF